MAVANQILAIVSSQSFRDVTMVTGYVLLARSLDAEGRLHSHALTPADQHPSETAELLADGQRSLTAEG